jgi:hypothetical protein
MTTGRTIKVRIPITVEIDVDAWYDEYGCSSVAEVREDAKLHIEDTVRQHLDSLGVLA